MPTEVIILILAIGFLFVGSLPPVERAWTALHDRAWDFVERRRYL